MKTAISIPNSLFNSAEEVAKELDMSRSELYTKAIKEFLEAHQYTNVTQLLNEVYTDESSQLDRELIKIQSASINKDNW